MRHLDEHLDDGLIHALLDGELSGEELAGARAHVLACEACSARVAEERLLAGEAERLIAELDEPVGPALGGSMPLPESPTVKGPPVVLIPQVPEESNRWQRRRGPSRAVGIAATVAIAAGAGFFALQSSSGPDTFGSDSVVSDMAPLPAPDERALALTDSGVAPAAPETAPSAAPGLATDAVESRLQELPAEMAERDAPVNASRVAEEGAAGARQDAAAPPPSAVQAKARENLTAPVVRTPAPRDLARAAPVTERAERVAEPQREQPSARDEAAAPAAQVSPRTATGAATAANESRGRDSVGVTSAPAPSVPAPRRASLSIEQQSQITMRIGLDEAQRLLGSPMHVIEGLQPEFVGLVPGRLVRGANPSDYVVRVVYLDENRRLIFLDQQRLDLTGRQMGMQRDTIPPEWVKGDVRLSLSGDISAESVRALARRVR
jgi:hypothetical protein